MISHQFTGHFGTTGNTSLLGGLRQFMAYFGNASRQLLESLQSVRRRTYTDLRNLKALKTGTQ